MSMVKKNILIIILISIFVFPNKIHASFKNIEYVDVRVSIKNIEQAIVLKSQDGFYIFDKETKDVIYEISSNEIEVLAGENGHILVNSSCLEKPLEFKGDFSNLFGAKQAGYTTVDNVRYRDYIGFIVKENNILSINYVKLDHYLFGVLPREIPASGGIEALKAQAIVARSYLYGNIDKHRKDGYGVCNTTHCQVYGGLDAEHENTNRAVLETTGLYVEYSGKIISTPFHSNSGGHTENSKYVWGGEVAYLEGVEDPYSLNSPNSVWDFTIDTRTLENRLRNNGINIGSIMDIEILDTTTTGRVTKLRIVGTLGQSEISGERLRGIIGTMDLKSALFTIKKHSQSINSPVYVIDGNTIHPKTINLNGALILDGAGRYTKSRQDINTINGKNENTVISYFLNNKVDSITFSGKGFGHGVGMSQYGALEMAKRGYTFEDIISHYYNGVNIIKLNR